MKATPPTKYQPGNSRQSIQPMAMVILGVAIFFTIGCQETVVREKTYYGGQFSNVTTERAPTARNRGMKSTIVRTDNKEKENDGFFSGMFSGLGKMFGGGKKDRTDAISPEKLQIIQNERAQEQAELDAARARAEAEAQRKREELED